MSYDQHHNTRNLVIDVGNSRIKYGVFQGRELVDSGILTSDFQLVAFEIWLSQIQVDRILMSSVRQLDSTAAGQWVNHPRVEVLNSSRPMPITIAYEQPETLGVDRLCGALGAHALFPGENVLSIDAGTCITYDLITSDAVFIGGGISPGLQMRYDAMHRFTGRLPSLQHRAEQDVPDIGRNTESSMQFGVLQGALAEMRAVILHFAQRYANLKIILTGGDGPFFEQRVENPIFAAPNLILIGLNEALLYRPYNG